MKIFCATLNYFLKNFKFILKKLKIKFLKLKKPLKVKFKFFKRNSIANHENTIPKRIVFISIQSLVMQSNAFKIHSQNPLAVIVEDSHLTFLLTIDDCCATCIFWIQNEVDCMLVQWYKKNAIFTHSRELRPPWIFLSHLRACLYFSRGAWWK